MERMRRHAERFATEIVNDHIHTVDSAHAALPAGRRHRRLHLRCADHRHRRGGQVPGPALRGEIPRPRRLGLRHLRRLLLPRPARRGRSAAATPRSRRRCTCRTSPQHVTLVHRRDKLRAEKILQDRLFREVEAGKMSVVWNHTVDEVLGDEHGVTGVRLRAIERRRARVTLEVTGLFIAIGHTPNTGLFAGQLDMREGYLTVRERRRRRCHRDQRARACSPPATSPITSTARRSPPPGAGCMAALDADRYLEALGRGVAPLTAPPPACARPSFTAASRTSTAARVECARARRQSLPASRVPGWRSSTPAASAATAAGSRAI